jgi:hypothetical protein
MKHKEILMILGPCGSNCRKCVFNINGDIRHHAEELEKLLGVFNLYAERFSELISPVFKKYIEFKELLNYLVQVDCLGCREQKCGIYPNCGVYECHREKKVDFCFQCDEFPCEKSNFDPDFKRRWILMNERMREIGAEAYCEESMKYPRYRSKVGPE